MKPLGSGEWSCIALHRTETSTGWQLVTPPCGASKRAPSTPHQLELQQQQRPRHGAIIHASLFTLSLTPARMSNPEPATATGATTPLRVRYTINITQIFFVYCMHSTDINSSPFQPVRVKTPSLHCRYKRQPHFIIIIIILE